MSLANIVLLQLVDDEEDYFLTKYDDLYGPAATAFSRACTAWGKKLFFCLFFPHDPEPVEEALTRVCIVTSVLFSSVFELGKVNMFLGWERPR